MVHSILFVETGWPSPLLSPNGSQRNYWARQTARRNAKKEGYVEAMRAMSGGFTWIQGGRFKLTIHARPPVKRRRDDDNLIASTKPFRDGIAQRLGIDDSHFDLQPVQWRDPLKPGRLTFEIEEA